MSTTVLALILAQAAASIPSSAPAVSPAAMNDRSKRLVCHSEEITGSLAGHRRICHTVAEWQQIHDNSVAAASDLADHGLIQPTNGR